MRKEYPELKMDISKHFLPAVVDIVIDTFSSIKHNLTHSCGGFEHLGYDFMID